MSAQTGLLDFSANGWEVAADCYRPNSDGHFKARCPECHEPMENGDWPTPNVRQLARGWGCRGCRVSVPHYHPDNYSHITPTFGDYRRITLRDGSELVALVFEGVSPNVY